MNPVASVLGSALYVAEVIRLYVELPDTPLRASLQDHAVARRFHQREVPLPTVESALLLGSLRRFARPADIPALPPIRSLAYFQPVVEELLEHPGGESYLHYLRLKMSRLPSEVPSAGVRKSTLSDDR
jgi:hypothetical protein